MSLQDTFEQLQSFDFNELDVNNIGAWPGAIKVILMLLVFSIVLGGGYYYYLTDKQTMLERAETKEQNLRNDYEKKAAQAVNLDAYRDQKTQMENTFGALVKQLPSDTEVPGLLEDITRTAIDNDLTIESIDLGSENITEFYAELPIDITVEGDYHKIGSFVSGVANLSRIVTLHDFTIAPSGSVQNLKMNIRAKTYRYLDDEDD
ncbi:MAG: type 4a pilus biogenesis protein PilO [Gammaproteobacteria bacterium]|nr:type 4a pilus biogenesis protein PilO [Gammaproteobacteria bacterium]